MRRQIVWQQAAARDYDALPVRIRDAIDRAVARLALTGLGDIKAYKAHPGEYRLRVGDHRVFFLVQGEVLLVLRISHRDHAYDC